MATEKNSPQRFLVTVIGLDNWNPKLRKWLERPAGTTADQVLAEFRKQYPPPYQIVVVPGRPKTSATG